MHYVLVVIISTLAAIGLLTIVAIASVIRFGDGALGKLQSW